MRLLHKRKEALLKLNPDQHFKPPGRDFFLYFFAPLQIMLYGKDSYLFIRDSSLSLRPTILSTYVLRPK